MLEFPKELALYLSLLVITHPRLALGILLVFAGAGAIWVISQKTKAKQRSMASKFPL